MQTEFLQSINETGARYSCNSCHWTGTNPSSTEDKQVAEDGRTPIRQWHAVCPKCFNYVSKVERPMVRRIS